MPLLQQIDHNRWYTNFGPLNSKLHQQLNHFFPNRYLTTTASGTSALELALAGLNLAKNSKILLPALTFPATVTAALRVGLQPVLADVERLSWQLTPEICLSYMAKNSIDAVLPVATFGLPLPTEMWDRFFEQTQCPIVIDAAGAFGNQSISTKYPVIFSLHATKNFSSAEGGLIVSANEKLIEQTKRLSNFGIENAGEISHNTPGCNAKMSEYHSAIGIASIDGWPQQKKKRQHLLNWYIKYLKPLGSRVQLQQGISGQCLSMFNVKLNSNNSLDNIINSLADSGIQTRRWYFPLLSNQPAFSELEIAATLTNSEKLRDTLLGLPFHLDLTENDIKTVCRQLDKAS